LLLTLLNTQTLRLRLGPTPDFAIGSLSTNGCQAIDVSGLTGSNPTNQGGVAASASRLFLNTDNSPGSFPLDDLGAGGLIGEPPSYLVSNLRTETVYRLAPVGTYSELFLLEVDGETGALTGNQFPLSRQLTLTPEAGFFSGYDRILIHNGLGELFSISLPWGEVTSLGYRGMGAHLAVNIGAYWGVAEHFGGENYLVYPRDRKRIVRMRVSDASTTTVASFDKPTLREARTPL